MSFPFLAVTCPEFSKYAETNEWSVWFDGLYLRR